MGRGIADQVVEFYDVLFGRIFSEPFRKAIEEPIKRRAVDRQVEEAADAASQSLTRFFASEQLSPLHVGKILESFEALTGRLTLEDISNPNVTPESVVVRLLAHSACPPGLGERQEAVYRVALHSIVQVLMLVGPVMAEWRKLKFSSVFELPRRVVNRLNKISESLGVIGRLGHGAADEQYELNYRDHLLQRFHRVESGTVRMTTNLDVDLRELFVMPNVREREHSESTEAAALVVQLMDLARARKPFEEAQDESERGSKTPSGVPALQQVCKSERLVIVGTPGSGKSTFLEWLQVSVAVAHEEFVQAGEQAIPLLIRVRSLDPHNLPCTGAELIEKATASKDRVKASFTKVLGDATRASKLLEHIRYRTGLLVERRPEVFAFAHLTFQEYLAARAIHEGNLQKLTVEELVNHYDDGRWTEVIALYCGLAHAPAARALVYPAKRSITYPSSSAPA